MLVYVLLLPALLPGSPLVASFVFAFFPVLLFGERRRYCTRTALECFCPSPFSAGQLLGFGVRIDRRAGNQGRKLGARMKTPRPPNLSVVEGVSRALLEGRHYTRRAGAGLRCGY